jgi:hypothetical protein
MNRVVLLIVASFGAPLPDALPLCGTAHALKSRISWRHLSSRRRPARGPSGARLIKAVRRGVSNPTPSQRTRKIGHPANVSPLALVVKLASWPKPQIPKALRRL